MAKVPRNSDTAKQLKELLQSTAGAVEELTVVDAASASGAHREAVYDVREEARLRPFVRGLKAVVQGEVLTHQDILDALNTPDFSARDQLPRLLEGDVLGAPATRLALLQRTGKILLFIEKSADADLASLNDVQRVRIVGLVKRALKQVDALYRAAEHGLLLADRFRQLEDDVHVNTAELSPLRQVAKRMWKVLDRLNEASAKSFFLSEFAAVGHASWLLLKSERALRERYVDYFFGELMAQHELTLRFITEGGDASEVTVRTSHGKWMRVPYSNIFLDKSAWKAAREGHWTLLFSPLYLLGVDLPSDELARFEDRLFEYFKTAQQGLEAAIRRSEYPDFVTGNGVMVELLSRLVTGPRPVDQPPHFSQIRFQLRVANILLRLFEVEGNEAFRATVRGQIEDWRLQYSVHKSLYSNELLKEKYLELTKLTKVVPPSCGQRLEDLPHVPDYQL